MSTALTELEISTLPLFRSGKVRDTYDLGDQLLMIATDRISAYDVVMADGVPDKGKVLTKLSAYWFEITRPIVRNHLLSTDLEDLPEAVKPYDEVLRDRFMIVEKAQRIDVECVVRGYLAGSAWAEYKESGTVCGQPLPAGLIESQQFVKPIFTPATKEDEGHDLNIPVEEMVRLIGADLTESIVEVSVNLYQFARELAASRGIILADTKFEFGLVNGELTLIDEIFTPDSSRFWDVEEYQPGSSQESFDKQYLRDWLTSSGWDRNPPPPPLPASVIEGTARRYHEAYQRITGEAFSSS